jgi:hypothetical protein
MHTVKWIVTIGDVESKVRFAEAATERELR